MGFDVSLNTYVSAVNNRYSLFYTEVINRWYRQSGYGKKIDILEQTLAVILGMYVQLLYRIA